MPPHDRDQSPLDAARAFAAEAMPLKVEFALRELPETLLAQSDPDIAVSERALIDQRHDRETRIEAGAAIGLTVEVGVAAARQLDSILRNKVGRDSATMVAWTDASRIQRSGGGGRTGQPHSSTIDKAGEGGNENAA